jgi:putative transposase
MASGGYVYHVLNRAVGRARLFDKSGDYAAFEKVLEEAKEWQPTRLLAYCIMPNHWHLILWPDEDGDLSEFMRWLTVTHTQRWHAHRHTAGTGPLYQGRFKSFPIQDDDHFLTVCRVRRAKCLTRPAGFEGGRLALVEFMAAPARGRRALGRRPRGVA